MTTAARGNSRSSCCRTHRITTRPARQNHKLGEGVRQAREIPVATQTCSGARSRLNKPHLLRADCSSDWQKKRSLASQGQYTAILRTKPITIFTAITGLCIRSNQVDAVPRWGGCNVEKCWSLFVVNMIPTSKILSTENRNWNGRAYVTKLS